MVIMDSLKFNKEVFGNIFRRKRHLEARLRGVQRRLEEVDSARFCLLEKELQDEYNKVLYQEELLWYQKSRENGSVLVIRILASSTRKLLFGGKEIKWKG